MKKVLAVCAALVCLGFILPVVNLAVDLTAKPDVASLPPQPGAHFYESAAILQNKCSSCHSSNVRMPIYAGLPGASALIQRDMTWGRATFDLDGTLKAGEKGPSDRDLNGIEYVINGGHMPPLRYQVMHWASRISSVEKQVLNAWIIDVRKARRAALGMPEDVIGTAFEPLPLTVSVDPKKAELGKKMFFDKRLSKDNSLSCASCHALDKGGTDREPVSTGINGQKGPINAPTVFNSSYNVRQFWDGRAADLAEQAAGPVHNPLEMGSNWAEVLPKLDTDTELVQQFKDAYPDGLTGPNIADAIAVFERTLVTPNSRFDQYLRGKKDALTPEEIQGMRAFESAGCVVCHAGPALGGSSFEKMGYWKSYFQGRRTITDADKGRFNFTKDAKDIHFFKVPTLRNIAQTGPYFHNASAATLLEAVHTMSRYQLRAPVTDEEAEKIAKFLQTLTGDYEGKPVT